MVVYYGQVVVGPPGSGKTTYCQGMQEYLRLLGRNAWVINLDPANEIPKSQSQSQQNSTNSDDDNDDDNNHDTTTTATNTTNNNLPYDTLLDVCESVVNVSSVMKQLGLGPNGGLIYCMEYMEAHTTEIIQTILARIKEVEESEQQQQHDGPVYLLIDLPGQVELYTHGTAVPKLLQQLVKAIDLRLVAVQLIDSHYCTEPSNFLSATLLATNIMLRLELPAVCVLSKVDLLVNYGPLPFNLEFFTECEGLDRLVPYLTNQDNGSFDDDEELYNNNNNNNINNNPSTVGDTYADDPEYQIARRQTRSSPFFRKHERLHQRIAETVEEFSLLSFLPLDIQDAESVGRVVARIDKANGYVFVASARQRSGGVRRKIVSPGQDSTNANDTNSMMTATTEDLFQVAMQSESSMYESIADVEERLVAAREHQWKEKRRNNSNIRK